VSPFSTVNFRNSKYIKCISDENMSLRAFLVQDTVNFKDKERPWGSSLAVVLCALYVEQTLFGIYRIK
jgi:hypothetical protein